MFGLSQTDIVVVTRGSYVLRPVCHFPASDDSGDEKTWSYIFLGEHYRRMGWDYGRTSQPLSCLWMRIADLAGDGFHE